MTKNIERILFGFGIFLTLMSASLMFFNIIHIALKVIMLIIGISLIAKFSPFLKKN